MEAQDNQIVMDGLEEQYAVLPRININGYYRLDNSLVVDLKNQTALFDHDNPDFVTGNRNRLDYGISWDKRWTWGYLRPQLRVKHLAYNLESGLCYWTKIPRSLCLWLRWIAASSLRDRPISLVDTPRPLNRDSIT